MNPFELTAWWALLLTAAVAPPLVLVYRFGAKWWWFGLGVASFIAGIILKLLLVAAAAWAGVEALPPAARAGAYGLISAVAELALVLPFFVPVLMRRGHVGWPNVLAFGVGIGIFEMVVVLLLGLGQFLVETGAIPTLPAFTEGLGWFFVTERVVTVFGHAATRALLYVGLRYRSAGVVLLSVCLFALNDGAAGYPEMVGWEWTPALLATMNGFFAALMLVEVTCVVVLDRWYGGGAAATHNADANDSHPQPPTTPHGGGGPAARVAPAAWLRMPTP